MFFNSHSIYVDEFDCHRILKLSDNQTQRFKALEELSELSVEVAKGNSPARIRGEMADVYIMLKQLEIMYDIDSFKLQNDINGKIDRTLSRLRNKGKNVYDKEEK